MTLRKFKFATFWMIQRMKVLVARNSRLPPPSRSRGRGQKRRKNRKDFPSSVLVTLTCFRASGGVRATGVNFAVGDYANGVVGRRTGKGENRGVRNDVVGAVAGG